MAKMERNCCARIRIGNRKSSCCIVMLCPQNTRSGQEFFVAVCLIIRASLDRTSSLDTDLDPSPGSLSLISRSEWKSGRYKPVLDVALNSDEEKTVVQSTEKKLHCKFSYGTRMFLALPWLICHVTGCQIVPLFRKLWVHLCRVSSVALKDNRQL